MRNEAPAKPAPLAGRTVTRTPLRPPAWWYNCVPSLHGGGGGRSMTGRIVFPLALACALLSAGAAQAADYQPGAPGAGDAFFPLEGNGGYDVGHYNLRLSF